jgi:hypothetical protein
MTRAEQETIVRWDQEERVVHLYTANPAQARRWARLGYPVEVNGRYPHGEPHSWRAQMPVEAIRFRRVVTRQPRGRGFRRKLAASEQGSQQGRAVSRPDEVEQEEAAN